MNKQQGIYNQMLLLKNKCIHSRYSGIHACACAHLCVCAHVLTMRTRLTRVHTRLDTPTRVLLAHGQRGTFCPLSQATFGVTRGLRDVPQGSQSGGVTEAC